MVTHKPNIFVIIFQEFENIYTCIQLYVCIQIYIYIYIFQRCFCICGDFNKRYGLPVVYIYSHP